MVSLGVRDRWRGRRDRPYVRAAGTWMAVAGLLPAGLSWRPATGASWWPWRRPAGRRCGLRHALSGRTGTQTASWTAAEVGRVAIVGGTDFGGGSARANQLPREVECQVEAGLEPWEQVAAGTWRWVNCSGNPRRSDQGRRTRRLLPGTRRPAQRPGGTVARLASRLSPTGDISAAGRSSDP